MNILGNVRKQHSQDCSTGIRIRNVPEIASQNSAQRLQHDMKHVMATLKQTKNPLFPTVSELVNMTKPSEEASSWSSQRSGQQEKFWRILIVWKIIQLFAVVYIMWINTRRAYKRKYLLKKRCDLIGNGTKRTSIRFRNLKLFFDGNEQPAISWQPTCRNLMLINARSVNKPNAVFHSSTDLAAQPIDWCFVTESWLNSDIDDIFFSFPNYNLFRCNRSAKNSKKKFWGGRCC